LFCKNLSIFLFQEFFTQQHWKQMPKCWQSFLTSIELEELGHWMSISKEDKLVVIIFDKSKIK